MFGLKINRNLDLSLTRQLCDQLRELIEKGILKSGQRLPSTRKMADELQISRNVMVEVYEQLTAEGYLESIVGSGTYVSKNIVQDRYINNSKQIIKSRKEKKIEENLDIVNNDIIQFVGGIPDLKLFPRKLWSKYLKNTVQNSTADIFGYGDILGDFELRKTLTDYLFRVKGIQCNPDQIIITSGSSEGFMLTARVFTNKYKSVFVEDPTVNFIKTIFNKLNYHLKPITVDKDGMKIEDLEKYKQAGLILLTPSHQFPTGSILPIHRRQRVIQIAETTKSYLVEDDYDSEFRLKGVPIPPLQVLNSSRVIYVSTFSKNMSPGLRLGFLVIPTDLINDFRTVKNTLNIRTSTIKQRAMAYFIKDGHLDRQIYRMKKEYKKRRSYMITLLSKKFGGDITIQGDETGMHLQLEFLPEKYNLINWNSAEQYGIKIISFEEYSLIKGENKNKIVLGYGNLDLKNIKSGINRLVEFVEDEIKE